MSGANDTSPSLENLMRLAQQGDKKAYARLFQAIVPILKAFISRRLNGMTDVDDVVQDILLSIHRASHTYDTDRPFKTWMFAIARHRLNDHLRLVYKKGAISEINIDEISHEIFDTDVTKSQERYEYLNEMISSLPEKQRKIITMMKLEGHSAAETAKAMKMNVSAVKVAAHRAYKALALKAGQDE